MISPRVLELHEGVPMNACIVCGNALPPRKPHQQGRYRRIHKKRECLRVYHREWCAADKIMRQEGRL